MRSLVACFSAAVTHRHCYFVSPTLLLLTFAVTLNLNAQCPSVATMLIDACPAGMEENNEYVIINSEGGFAIADLTIDFAMGNNAIGTMGSNNDINTNVNNDPAFPAPCGLIPGDLSIYTGGCNLVAVGPGDIIPPDVPVIVQMSSDPTQTIDLSAMCANGETIYVTRNSCDRTIGAFTNGGSGTRTTNFGFGGGCFEAVTYDRGSLPGGNGAYFSPCEGNVYGNDGCSNVVDVSSCFPPPPPCPDPITPVFEICADAPVVNPPVSLLPATLLFPGASSVTFHNTFADANAGTGAITTYGGQATMSVTLFARVEYPDGCVVIGGLTLNFLMPDGNAGNDATLNVCAGDQVDLLGALGLGVTAGLFSDDNGAGVNLTNPSAVDFTGVTPSSYNFTYTTFDNPATPCPPDEAVVTVNVSPAPVANGPQMLTECDNGSGVAIFNLTTLNNAINGGTGLPVTYYTNPGATIVISNPSGFASGNATVFAVVNASGTCSSQTVAISLNLDVPPTVASMFTEPSCNGANNGSISLNVSGSTPPYNFDWNPDALDGQEDPTNLPAGNYFVTVTGVGGCPTPLAFTLTDPPAISTSSCQELTQASGPINSDGVGVITVTGGTPNYTVNFTGPVSGSVSGSGPQIQIAGLPPGNYMVNSITDANNCTVSNLGCSFTITSAAMCALAVEHDASDVLCFDDNNGSITLTINGNIDPVQIQWSVPGFDNQTMATGLSPGDYSVTITDPGVADCDTIINPITIGEPAELMVSCTDVIAATGPANADGSMMAVYSGGTAPYDLQLFGPTPFMTTAATAGSTLIENLLPGAYSLVVTDENNCEETCTFTVDVPNPQCAIMVNVDSVVNVACFGDSTGFISLDTSGFMGDMSVVWSNGLNEDSLFQDSLSAGFYSVTITDEGLSGCSVVIDSIEISQSDSLILEAFEFSPASGPMEADGVANLIVTGGIPPYTYTISGPTDTTVADTTASDILIGGLLPGLYSATVTDSSGCMNDGLILFEITFLNCDLTASIDTVVDVSCFGGSNGGVIIEVENNVAPVDVSWSDPAFDDLLITNSLPAGAYTVTVSDPGVANCSVVVNFDVDEPTPLILSCDADVQTSGPTASDATATINFLGGVAPYDISVSGPVPSVFVDLPGPSIDLTNLSVGVYSVVITDANDCTNTCQFTVTPQGCTLDVMVNVTGVSCNGEEDATISLIISGNNGSVDVDWDQDQYDGQQDLGNVPPGIYNAVITDQSGCSIPVGPIEITNPEVLEIECSVLNDVSNPNQMDGAAQGIVTGGTAPYQVILRRIVGLGSVNDTVALAVADTVFRTDLVGSDPAQAYEFVVVDANGCRDTCAFSIFEPPCPASFITQNVTDVACPGDSTGRIEVTVVNANPPLTYSWMPMLPDTNIIDNVPAGTYTLIVTDTFGCTTAGVVTVNEPAIGDPALPTVSCMAVNDETIPGAMNGSGQVTISGDRFPFTLDVSGPVSSVQNVAAAGVVDLTNLSEGTYVVFITDSSGCVSDTCSFTIGVGACNLSIGATVTPEDCSGLGQIALDITGGTQPYTIEWSDPQFDGMDTIMAPASNYAVTVTDDAGCIQTLLETVTLVDNAPTLDYILELGICFNDSVSLALQPSNGTPGYTYFFTTDPGGPVSIATLSTTTDTTVYFPAPVLMPGETSFNISIDSLVDANGCTLIVDENNDVIVNPADSLFFNGPQCVGDTITLEGQQFYAGNATDTFYVETATSCGFVYLVDFDFNVAVVDTLEETLCPEDSLVVGDVVFNGNNLEGLVELGIPSINGCDSSVYVRIDYLPVSIGSFTTSACEGDTIFFGPDFYTFDDPAGSTVLEGQAANGCDSLVFVTVNFQPEATVELVGDDAICLGDTAMLLFETMNGGPFNLTVRDSDGNTYNYGGVMNGDSFPVNPTVSTIYTLVDVSQGGLGCPIDYSGNMEVQVSRLLGNLEVGQEFAGNQISCYEAADGSLTASILEGVAPFTFVWNDSITGPQRNNLGPGNYEVTITDSVGCQQVYAANLQEPAPILADPMILPPGCNERDGFLVLDTIRGGVGPYELTVDGNFYQAITNFPYRQLLPPGAYNLEIRDVADCFNTYEINVPEPADPDLLITEDTIIQMGDSLLLSAQTSFRPDSIRWEPANLVSTPNALSTYAMPLENTRFFITVMDTTGCRAAANVLVQVDERVPVYIPTAFSPNTDGSNDLFQLYGDRGVKRINTFMIFNRWGELVYQADDFDITNTAIGWDGKHRGKLLNPQVLVYYVNATLVDGRVVELKGDLTLIH